jgi:hypothetical protein
MKHRVKILFGILIITSTALSCFDYQMKFDKVAWNTSNDPAFPPPNRDKMLKDLIENHKLVGLKYSQLTDSLGRPDIKENHTLGYRIEEDYGKDIDPVYTKDLIFYFSKDSIITLFKVSEWKK